MNCAEKSGFLFDHPCKQAAGGQCQKCSKQVCTRHTHPTPNGYMCTTCAKKEVKRARRQRNNWSGWDDEPYMYGVYYYDGYGYYGRGRWGNDILGDDFSEADGDGLGHEGDGGWDDGMGMS